MLAWSIWVLTAFFQIWIFGIYSDPILRFERITLPIFHELLNGEAKSVRLSLALKAGIEDNEETFENGYVPLQYKTPLNINRAAARIITNFELKSKYRVATSPNGFRNQSILSLKFYFRKNFKSNFKSSKTPYPYHNFSMIWQSNLLLSIFNLSDLLSPKPKNSTSTLWTKFKHEEIKNYGGWSLGIFYSS